MLFLVFLLIGIFIQLLAQQWDPPNCPGFDNKKDCLRPKVGMRQKDPWCHWKDGLCRWDAPNIEDLYCFGKALYNCRPPFCHINGSFVHQCRGSTQFCLDRITAATCAEAHCIWFPAYFSYENPGFPVCGYKNETM